MTTKEAVDKIRYEIKNDKGYYIAWQSNIAVAFRDELHRRGYKLPDEHEISNQAAQNFISNLIKDTTEST
jgi:hypothetical protein